MPRRLALLILFVVSSVCANAQGVKELAQEQGFFFFYSSSCPHCQRFAPILKRVSQRYGFSVIAISVDGGFLSSFPDAVLDAGQSKMFKVNVLPSLFLIHPKKQLAQLVTEGAIGEEELVQRLRRLQQEIL